MGLSLSLPGEPSHIISESQAATTVQWQAPRFCSLKPDNLVVKGQRVQCGQALFTDALAPSIAHTAPASGVVTRVSFTEQRLLQSIDILCDDQAAVIHDIPEKPYSSESIRNLLQQSGLWVLLRERPFEVIPAADAIPAAVFVTAMDTRPLAPDAAVIIADRFSEFKLGVEALVPLTTGKVFVSQASASAVASLSIEGVEQTVFLGKHPAGLAGTHIQYLHPASQKHPVWHMNYQDVIAIGSLIRNGVLSTEHVIALAGEPLREPRLLRTQRGALIADILNGQLIEDEQSIQTISGSVFAGQRSEFLRHFDSQLVVYPSARLPHAQIKERTAADKQHSESMAPSPIIAFVSEPRFESISPLPILPVPLLRALLVGDLSTAQGLGCLELAEEDLELHTYICPAGNDYSAALRYCLQTIQSAGA